MRFGLEDFTSKKRNLSSSAYKPGLAIENVEKILIAIKNEKGLSKIEICGKVGFCLSTVRAHLKTLIRNDKVIELTSGEFGTYYIAKEDFAKKSPVKRGK